MPYRIHDHEWGAGLRKVAERCADSPNAHPIFHKLTDIRNYMDEFVKLLEDDSCGGDFGELLTSFRRPLHQGDTSIISAEFERLNLHSEGELTYNEGFLGYCDEIFRNSLEKALKSRLRKSLNAWFYDDQEPKSYANRAPIFFSFWYPAISSGNFRLERLHRIWEVRLGRTTSNTTFYNAALSPPCSSPNLPARFEGVVWLQHVSTFDGVSPSLQRRRVHSSLQNKGKQSGITTLEPHNSPVRPSLCNLSPITMTCTLRRDSSEEERSTLHIPYLIPTSLSNTLMSKHEEKGSDRGAFIKFKLTTHLPIYPPNLPDITSPPPMSTLLAVSRFLGGRTREKRNLGSTGSAVSINNLGSTSSLVSQSAPKNPLSKLANIVASNPVPPSVSTLTAARSRSDSIVESSSDTDSVSASSNYRTPIAENLPSNAPLRSNKSAGDQAQARVQEAEEARDRAQKRARELEEERDQAISDAKATQDTAQIRIQELEGSLKANGDELSAKSQALDALTVRSEGLQSEIDTLKADLGNALAVSKDMEDERDRALAHAREANDAHLTAQARILTLEDDVSVKSQEVNTLTTDAERTQSKIDALTTDLHNSLAASKNLEEERDTVQIRVREMEDAQTTAQARIQELENGLKSTRDELNSKSQALAALTVSSETLRSQVDTLTTDLRMCAQELEQELDQAQLRAREVEEERSRAQKYIQDLEEERDKAMLSIRNANDARLEAQARIQVLEYELASKSESVSALATVSNRLQSQVEDLTTDLRDALAVRKDAEAERDAALVRAHNTDDAHADALARIQSLEAALQFSNVEITSRTQKLEAFTTGFKGLQSEISALKSDFRNALTISKLREEERDVALANARDSNGARDRLQTRVQELEDALKAFKVERNAKSPAPNAVTQRSGGLQSHIDTLKTEIRNTLAAPSLMNTISLYPPFRYIWTPAAPVRKV
ncbi:hypothetical protein BDN70DRAFT_900014 [Pholiota conissans]|uniref:Uncharacterized protein n=1 Tax=Pholiota conissans TaxID=109636 RepID=A0A9P5YNP7_9AGAR|nr:hypothetical protein BDN70DRAFT_900014 [Pholiota conissans]